MSRRERKTWREEGRGRGKRRIENKRRSRGEEEEEESVVVVVDGERREEIHGLTREHAGPRLCESGGLVIE